MIDGLILTQVNEEGGAQSLVERERTVTEVLHWEAPLTEEAAHRETIAYEQVRYHQRCLLCVCDDD